jgi:UrcA family protein
MSITSNRAFVLAAALVAGTVGFAAPTFAATGEDGVRTMSVSYADLDVHSTAGQKMLKHRINAAAHEVCKQAGNGLEVETDVRVCKVSAKANARDALAKKGVPAA